MSEQGQGVTAESEPSYEDAYDPQFECQSCGVRMSDDGADSLLGWMRDEDGELSFCAKCGPPLKPPSPKIMSRYRAGATRYMEFKDLLHEHRDGALTCYDHPGFYCCPCGEHMALGYQEHLAAVLAKREAALATPAASIDNSRTDAALAEVERRIVNLDDSFDHMTLNAGAEIVARMRRDCAEATRTAPPGPAVVTGETP